MDEIERPETSVSETGMHLWVYSVSYNYDVRMCTLCGLTEVHGPGGWSTVQ